MDVQNDEDLEILILGTTHYFNVPKDGSKELKQELLEVEELLNNKIQEYLSQFPNDSRENTLSHVVAIMAITLAKIKIEKDQEVLQLEQNRDENIKQLKREIIDITSNIQEIADTSSTIEE